MDNEKKRDCCFFWPLIFFDSLFVIGRLYLPPKSFFEIMLVHRVAEEASIISWTWSRK